MHRIFVIGLTLAVACGDDEPSDSIAAGDAGADDAAAPAPDAGDALDLGAPDSGEAACDPLDAVEVLSAGGRAFIAAGAGASVAWPETWRALPAEASRVGARIPVDAAGTYTATVTTPGCAPEAVTLEVEPLAWRTLTPWSIPEGPDEREHPAIFFDPNDPDRLILYGGFGFTPEPITMRTDAWSLDLATEAWTRLASTGDTPAPTGRYVVHAGAVYLEGGLDQRAATPPPYTMSRLTLTATAAHWTEVPMEGALAAPPYLHGLLPNPSGDGYLSVGGIRGNRVSSGVWTVDLEAQSLQVIPVDDIPLSGRYGFGFASDPEGGRIIIASGAGLPTGSDPVNALPDTWSFSIDGGTPRWSELLPEGVPPRRNGCHAFDPEGRRLFMWGGTADAMTSVPGLWVLELDDGQERWVQVDLPDSPPLRASCTAVYDPARRQILFGFGNTTQAVYADLHALEL